MAAINSNHDKTVFNVINSTLLEFRVLSQKVYNNCDKRGNNMRNQSLSNKILSRMSETCKGTIYTNSDFYDLGSADAVRKSLSRLYDEKIIYRLIDGYYTIPYFIEVVQECSYPTANELAHKIAEKYSWNITHYGENALNQVGLSTQVPVLCEYLSDGPYREFKYLNTTIKFKHTSQRHFSNGSHYLSLIIQSIKAIGKDNITDKHIQIISKFSRKYVTEDMLEEAKSVPVWIYEVIKKVEKIK